MGPLTALIRKEFRQFFRSKPLVMLIIWTIAVEIAICAYAITYDVRHIAMVVHDLDGSPLSRELLARFTQNRYFDLRYRTTSTRQTERLLETGRATLALVIPADFSRQLGQSLPTSVQILLDGSNSNMALIALGYARRILHAYGRDVELRWLQRVVGNVGPLPSLHNRPRAWYSPDLRSVHFVVVAMLTLGVLLIAILHPAAALAWEKEAGTIEQLLVMPFRAWELMLAKVVPTFVVSLASLALALWVPWWFGVPIRGSLPLFFALSALFLLSGLGLGLLFGTMAENLQQALLLGFFAIFPLWVISGTMVPVEGMPWPIRLLSYASPLRYYLEIGLGIFLKGVGIEVLWPQAMAMGGLGLGIFALGLWRFRQHLG
jgi:ABC-2 type transport system permease protein